MADKEGCGNDVGYRPKADVYNKRYYKQKADIQRRQIMNGEEYNVLSTIDVPVSLEDIEQLAQRKK